MRVQIAINKAQIRDDQSEKGRGKQKAGKRREKKLEPTAASWAKKESENDAKRTYIHQTTKEEEGRRREKKQRYNNSQRKKT